MATICVDSWSTRTNVGLLGISVGSDLLALVESRGEKHTGEWLTEVVTDQLEKAEKAFKLVITSIVTDGASNMGVLRRNLVDRGYIGYPCQAHALNLLMGDIMKDAGRQRVLNTCVQVLTKFRNVQALTDMLALNNIARPPLPCETRWGSTYDSLLYYNQAISRLVFAKSLMEMACSQPQLGVASTMRRTASSPL